MHTPNTLQIEAQNYIKRSVLLTSREKLKWLEKITIMPRVFLERLVFALKKTDKLMDSYLAASISKNPKNFRLTELKQKLKTMHKKVFKAFQQEEIEKAEEQLEKEVNMI